MSPESHDVSGQHLALRLLIDKLRLLAAGPITVAHELETMLRDALQTLKVHFATEEALSSHPIFQEHPVLKQRLEALVERVSQGIHEPDELSDFVQRLRGHEVAEERLLGG